MRFEEIYDCYQKRELSCDDTADVLGISVRTFLCKRRLFEKDNFDGSFDRRIGKPSHRRAGDSEVESLTKLYKDRHKGFTAKHFYQFAKQSPTFSRSYNWCRLTLQKEGLLPKSSRGGKHRLRRERKPMAGMMLHQDGSTHRWIEALDYNVDLIVTMDDGTSEITSAFFVEQEGTMSSFQGITETIQSHGLFCTFYTDRGSHYAYTSEEGGKVDAFKFSIKAEDPTSAYVRWGNQMSLSKILCVKEDRVVQKDNTVRYHNLILQIPPSEHRHHYVKAAVEVREYLDGNLSVFYGHQCIGHYDQIGNALSNRTVEEMRLCV